MLVSEFRFEQRGGKLRCIICGATQPVSEDQLLFSLPTISSALLVFDLLETMSEHTNGFSASPDHM